MSVTRVHVLKNVETPVLDGPLGRDSGYKLCFQWCCYMHADGVSNYGYRFIWKDPEERHLSHRGQARIPSFAILKELLRQAEAAGWANLDGAIAAQYLGIS